jgi:hypothetical protein
MWDQSMKVLTTLPNTLYEVLRIHMTTYDLSEQDDSDEAALTLL